MCYNASVNEFFKKNQMGWEDPPEKGQAMPIELKMIYNLHILPKNIT